MSKRNLKLLVVPSIYVLAIVVFCFALYLAQKVFNVNSFSDEMIYVDNEIVTDNLYIPVVNTENPVMRPFLNDSVYVSKSFYNYNGDASGQENAIIYYEGTYMQNSGVDYKFSSKFDVISVLDGTVIEVTENNILGKTIKIQHENNLISVYQSLDDISVNVDDNVLRGQVIGSSGTSSLYSNDFNLHFELIYQGVNVNPEEYYNKSINEF